MTRALVVGFGSIGQRHARVLAGLNVGVAVVSRRPVTGWRTFPDLPRALAEYSPDHVVVATETSAHRHALEQLAQAGFAGRVLVEKPLGVTAEPPRSFPFALAVAYNLRFHPVLVALKAALHGQRVISCQAYCGQYLPDWRPGTDYRTCYSADPAQGGGVLRDLSHEIDLLGWMFGACRRLTALGGKLSDLDIASDDCWGLLMEMERCPVATLQINYLDRPGRRALVVNTAAHTLVADLSRGVLVRDGKETALPCARDDTYISQHRAMLEGRMDLLCDQNQGEAALRVVEAAERAARDGTWVAP